MNWAAQLTCALLRSATEFFMSATFDANSARNSSGA